MNTPYHQKAISVAFVSPSPTLFGKSQNCLRSRLGIRARLFPYDTPEAAQRGVRLEQTGVELVALDSAAISSLAALPQFPGADDAALPVLLLLRKGETAVAEAAMEAGYKALLFIDSDAEYRQLFPGMILRMVAFYRGNRNVPEIPDPRAAAPKRALSFRN